MHALKRCQSLISHPIGAPARRSSTGRAERHQAAEGHAPESTRIRRTKRDELQRSAETKAMAQSLRLLQAGPCCVVAVVVAVGRIFGFVRFADERFDHAVGFRCFPSTIEFISASELRMAKNSGRAWRVRASG